MAITKRQETGPVLSTVRIKRRQVRKPQRSCEATAKDWARWEHGADVEGVNFAEFTRRALEARTREFVK